MSKTKIDTNFMDMGYIDMLSRQETIIHKLDPRAKLLTSLIFIATVVSFNKYEISSLLPFLIYPVFLCILGRLPFSYIIKKIIIVSPFAIMIGIFNPFMDQVIIMNIGGLNISGGWVSFLSILSRFVLTVGVTLILIGVTGFNSICLASKKLGAPNGFVIQLMFLYRYLFVLTEEAMRMVMARALRSPDLKRGMNIKNFGTLLGHLLLRTLDRARRIQLAMICRGFDGQIRIMKQFHFGWKDACFVCFWSALFIFMRYNNVTQFIGSFFMEVFI